MSEHTKTPWTIRPERYDDWGWIRGADGELACIARHHDRKDDDTHRMDKTDPYAANAAFIVKAVNSHAILVEALQFIADGYDNHDVNHVDFRVKAYQVALDALASIKERA